MLIHEWETGFPEILYASGELPVDDVIKNPPEVRKFNNYQEWVSFSFVIPPVPEKVQLIKNSQQKMY